MVDVGAHYGSSLEPFANDGWTVYAFEPDPRNRNVLEQLTRHLPGVVVDERAIGTVDEAVMTLFGSEESSGISSLRPFHPTHQPVGSVTTVRLDTFLALVPEVTFLKVDAEGQDLEVLETFPWSRLHPSVVVAEFEDGRPFAGYTHGDLGRYLADRGYEVLVSEWFPIVRYGVRHRWRDLHRYPSELCDPRGWGNVIAADPAVLPEIVRNADWQRRSRALLARARNRARRTMLRGART